MSKLPYCAGFAIAVISYLFYRKYTPVYVSLIRSPEKRYDYIIVGAGTSGCVLAARLSEDPSVSVLLVEAGEHFSFLSTVPAAPTVLQQGTNDWSFLTTPQKYSSFGMWNQRQRIPRGKGLGGSGQMNYLMHGFGLQRDFDEWKEMGATGLSHDDMVPYFIKAFGTAKSEYTTESCATGDNCQIREAPMKLKIIDHYSELLKTFEQASSRSDSSVFQRSTSTIDNGRRVSTYDAYMEPASERKNLHVLTKSTAVAIKFNNSTAVSLYILKNNRHLDNIFIDREIILSAGTIKTPQILMLSGVGPRKVLEKHRIKIVKNVAAVGANLYDQMNIPIYVSIKKRIGLTLAKILTIETVWDYLWNRSGYLAYPPLAGVELTDNSSAVTLFALGSASETLLRDLSNYRPKVFQQTFPHHNSTKQEGFMFLATCLQPRSRGSVALAGNETMRQPVVDPNYLAHPYDTACMIKAMRRAAYLVTTPPFQSIGATLHWPRPERCQSLWTEPVHDVYLECLLREVAVTGHHVGGTCAMARDGVVDRKLRLKSMKRVRIVDASVLPSPVSLYPNSVLVALAEKAADMIRLAFRRKSSSGRSKLCDSTRKC